MEDFEYTQEMYEEDNKLVHYIIFKALRLYPFLETKKDDLFSDLWLLVYKTRQNFDESKNAKFATYFLSSARFAIKRFLQEKIENLDENCISLDTPIGDDGDMSLLDMFSCESDFDSSFRFYELLSIIENVISCYRTDKTKDIVRSYLEHFNIQIVADNFGISRQYVSQIIISFKKDLQEELIKQNFVDSSYFNDKIYTSKLRNKISENERLSVLFNIPIRKIYSLYRSYSKKNKGESFETYIKKWLNRQAQKKSKESKETYDEFLSKIKQLKKQESENECQG